jgi:hypothetical protein
MPRAGSIPEWRCPGHAAVSCGFGDNPPCSATAYPSSICSRVVSLDRARTAGSDSVNEARGQSRSLQRPHRLGQISRKTCVP